MYEGAFPLKLTHNLKSSFQTGFGASALVVVSTDEPTFKVATTPEESGVRLVESELAPSNSYHLTFLTKSA